jgi:hypothetical protein
MRCEASRLPKRSRKPSPAVRPAGRYSANLTAGSLKVAESRIVADLLLKGASREEWRRLVTEENVLKARKPATAQRLGRLIWDRLSPMHPDLWTLVRDGAGDVATHAVLAAAIRHSPLVGDFLDRVVREHYRRFGKALNNRVWDDYLEACRGWDAEMPPWSESTVERLRSSVFQILAQAGFLRDTRSLALQRPHISEQVVGCLKRHREDYVLRCITVGS